MEQQPHQVSKNEHGPGVEVTNMMQMELIERSGINPMAWIGKYGEGFRKLVTADPSLVEDYEKEVPGSLELIQEKLQSTVP